MLFLVKDWKCKLCMAHQSTLRALCSREKRKALISLSKCTDVASHVIFMHSWQILSC